MEKRLDSKEIERLLALLARGAIAEGDLDRLNREASYDPFLREAIEGYVALGGDTSDDLKALAERLRQVSTPASTRQKVGVWRWMGVAASIVLLMGLGWWFVWSGLSPLQDRYAADLSPITAEDQVTSDAVSDLDLGDAAAQRMTAEESSRSLEESRAPSNRSPATAAESPAQSELSHVDRPPASPAEQVSPADLALSRQQQPAPRRIEGIVMDDVGRPLAGVSLRERSSDTESRSDERGQFVLNLPPANALISVSHPGYQTAVVEPPEVDTPIHVELSPSLAEVDQGALAKRRQVQPDEIRPREGWPRYEKYLSQQQNYPQAARQHQVAGTVTVSFLVKADGRPADLRIEKSLGYGCDEEAMRLIREGPLWQASPTLSSERAICSIRFVLE